MSNQEKASKSFIIYCDNEIIVCRLPDNEAGQLFKSLFPYVRENIKPDFDNSPALAMAFDIMSMAIDRDKEKYKKRCERNRENIEKRWNKNDSNEYERIQPNTKHTDNDSDNDSDSDSDNDSDNDNDKDRDCKGKEINYQQIADMYNATCVSFPRLTKLSDKRKKAIKARLKMYSVDDFKKLFDMAEASNFLKGKNNKNWSATFDWLIADSNMAKVLDGNYSNKDQWQQSSTPVHIEEPSYMKKYRDLPTSPDDPFQ